MRPLEQLLNLAPGPDWLALAAMVWWVLMVLAHVGFAAAVAVHARGRTPALAPAWLWVLATLACGPLVGVGYWFLHSSMPATFSRGARLSNSTQQPTSAPEGARG